MTARRKPRAYDWIVVGGAPGEVGHCTRCGEGLRLELPVRLEVFTGASGGFVEAHKHCTPGRYVASTPTSAEEWLKSRDTGSSSLTIYHVMTGKHVGDPDRYHTPIDPSDFGRCYRLLELVPAWRARLPEVATRFPAWGPLVREWTRLEALYLEELPDGTAPKLYAAMRQLEKECDPCEC